MREALEVGFKALIKIIPTDKLDDSFLGKDLSIPLIDKIKLTAADVCGENGEYHTFVYDGPIFAYPIAFEIGEVIDFGKHKDIDIRPCQIKKSLFVVPNSANFIAGF